MRRVAYRKKRIVPEKHEMNLRFSNYNQVNISKKSLKMFGLKTWDKLPYHIKSWFLNTGTANYLSEKFAIRIDLR